MNVNVCKDVEWVGCVDWSIRDFHGYQTDRGTSYNAYLVRDKKTALIDTVKDVFGESLLSNISALMNPEDLDYVVCNHAEPDHAGALPEVMSKCVNAELLCNKKCREALSKHFDISSWKIREVEDDESVSLGEMSLTFINTPMVHWPESMFTYVPERNLLFSMDAFGQHYASSQRFDDQEPLDVVMQEAKTYYANIVMLYNKPIQRTLERTAGYTFDIIAPSHGVIWRRHIDKIVSAYMDWVQLKPTAKVMIVYDTMWKSTEIMANAIMNGVLEQGLDLHVTLYNVRATNMTLLATEALDAAAIAFGSPTLNQTLMPQMAAILTYLSGLRPTGKSGFAFGSYGWSPAGAREVEVLMKKMGFDILREPLQSQYVPNDAMIAECYEAGKLLAKKAMETVEACRTPGCPQAK